MPSKEEEVAMMQNPMRWPQMVLPVKRSFDDVGILLGQKPTVYLINMWELSGPLSKLEEGPKNEYPSYDAIVEDGWVVD